MKGVLRAPSALVKVLRRLLGGYDVAVSTGSNHSIAVALAAWAKGVKIVNLESSVRFVEPNRAFILLRRIAWLNVVRWREQTRSAPNATAVGPFYEKPRGFTPHDNGYIWS